MGKDGPRLSTALELNNERRSNGTIDKDGSYAASAGWRKSGRTVEARRSCRPPARRVIDERAVQRQQAETFHLGDRQQHEVERIARRRQNG